ncbi:MAG: thiamine phosphate synthase [Bacteroidota bacterium]|nr:thiamine phosphate synthase [Bacteroidota bacterium]
MTNLIVISPAEDVSDEINIVNNLFDNGLELFHIRKPQYTEYELIRYIEKISPEYLSKVSIHQHHQIVKGYDIRYLHYNETARKEGATNYFLNYEGQKITQSTSCHNWRDVTELQAFFEYCFFSPVYDSISKQGYMQKISKDFKISANETNVKVFALGGINSKNVTDVLDRGFYGVAVLGAIWSQTNDSLNVFKELYKKCKLYANLY